MPKVEFRPTTLDELTGYFSWSILRTFPNNMLEQAKKFYPELSNVNLKADKEELQKEIKESIKDRYQEDLPLNEELVPQYKEAWSKYNDKYMNAMEDYFNMKYPNAVFTATVGNYPSFPRNLINHTFGLAGYKNKLIYGPEYSERDLFSIVVHECSHFFFFKKCEEIFDNLDNVDCNNPSLLWHLSEMAIDPILNSEQVQSVFPYKYKANPNCYLPKKDNHLMMDDIKNIFNNNSIEDAIKIGYQYLVDNEKELREANHDNTEIGSLKILKTKSKKK